jgi:gliding motility-associated-like protein
VIFLVQDAPSAPTVTVGQLTCEGVPNTGTIVTNPTGPVNWYNDAALTDLINLGAQLQGNVNTPVTVYVTQNSGDCVSPATPVVINFAALPDVSITATPLVGDAPLEVTFNSVFSNNVDNFIWNYGDGSSSQTANANPVYTYQDSGVYGAYIKVFTIDGCMDSAFVEIDVNQYVALFIPNVFSPNGDGKNDAFKFQINPNDISTFKAAIFDRWGKRVVDFNAVTETWDGGDYPAGTYYWVIEATKTDGSEFKPATGFFKLIK